jgi:hypothetical protein
MCGPVIHAVPVWLEVMVPLGPILVGSIILWIGKRRGW